MAGRSSAGAGRAAAGAGAAGRHRAAHGSRRARRRDRRVRLRDDVPAPRARPARRSTSPAIQRHLEAIGDSVLVAGDRAMAKVHVHNERPDPVIAYGLSLGTLSRITIENLDGAGARRPRGAGGGVPRDGGSRRSDRGDGRRDRRRVGTRRGEPTTPATARRRLPLRHRRGRPRRTASPRCSTSTPPGSASSSLCASSAAARRANPSTGELLEAVEADRRRRAPAPAEQPERRPRRAPGRRDDRPAGPRRPDPQRRRGLRRAAGARPDATRPRRTSRAMTEAGRAVQTMSRSPRPSATRRSAAARSRRARRSRSTRTTGSSRSTTTRDKAVLAGRSASSRRAIELITLYYGDGADLADAEALAAQIQERGTGRSRSSVRPRRPAPLPVPDLGRVRVTGGPRRSTHRRRAAARARQGRGAGPDRSRSRSSTRPSAQSGLPRRHGAPPGRPPPRHRRRFATSCSTCRGGTTTCARCATLGDLARVEDGEPSSAPGSGSRDIRVEPSFRRRVQRTIAVLEDETGTIEATWFGRRFIERRLHAGRRADRVGQAQALRLGS